MKRIGLFFLAIMLVIGACVIPIGADNSNVGVDPSYLLAASYDFSSYSAKTVEIGVVEYNVVYTAEDFLNLTMETDGAYILANDITIGSAQITENLKDASSKGKSIVLAKNNSKFYGNGKTITVEGWKTDSYRCSLFGGVTGLGASTTFELYDLTVKGDFTFGGDASGVLFSYVYTSDGLGGAGLTVQNVHLDVEITAMGACTGAMFGYARYPKDVPAYKFVNCSVAGTFYSFSETGDIGAYIGRLGESYKQKYNVTFDHCTSDMFIDSKGGSVGGFVGHAQGAKSYTSYLNFEACEFKGTIIDAGSTGKIGSFVGRSLTKNSTFKDCISSGKIVSCNTSVSSESSPFVGAREVDEEIAKDNSTYTTETLTELKTRKGANVAYADYMYKVLSAPSESKVASVCYQMADADEGYKNVRMMVLVKQDAVDAASNFNWTIKLMTGENAGKQLVYTDKNEVDYYYSVLGGSYAYDTPEGYVLMAVEIANVPVTVEDVDCWNYGLGVSLVLDGETILNENY